MQVGLEQGSPARPVGCQELGRTAGGGHRWASEQSFVWYLQPLPSTGITASAPAQIIRHEILIGVRTLP